MMKPYRTLSRRQSLALAIGGPAALAALSALGGGLIGIRAPAVALDPSPPVPDGERVPLPRPASPGGGAAAPRPLTLESLSSVLAAGACEDWPRSLAAASPAVTIRYSGKDGTFVYHHGGGGGSGAALVRQGKTGGEGLAAALGLAQEVSDGAGGFVLVSSIEPADSKGPRIESAAAAGRAAERVRIAAEGLGLRARLTDRFAARASIERFGLGPTEAPLLIVVLAPGG